jgi:hypothetical protein
VGYMARSMTLCLDKARQKLGYVPVFSNAESFQHYRQWARAKG